MIWLKQHRNFENSQHQDSQNNRNCADDTRFPGDVIFSVVSFVLSIYHKITEKISPKIGYLGNCTDGEIREDAGSDEKGGKTGVEKTCMEGQRELAAPAVVHSGAARIHSVQLYSDSCFNPDPIQGL